MHLKQKHSWQSGRLQLRAFQPRLSKTTSPKHRGILIWKKFSTYRKTVSLILTSLTDKMFSFEDSFKGPVALRTGYQPYHASCPIYRHHCLQFAYNHRNWFLPICDNVSAIRYILFSHVTAAIMVFQSDETAAVLVFQSNLLGVKLFSCVITFFGP